MADNTNASASTPWFTVGPDGGRGQGLSITTQRTALNEQVTLVANDLPEQSTALLAALQTVIVAIQGHA